MPKYAPDDLIKLKDVPPPKLEYPPEQHVAPMHGAKIQCSEEHDKSPVLLPEDIKHIKRAVGLVLHYVFALDSTILCLLDT